MPKYSIAELERMAAGKVHSDLDRIRGMSEAELEAKIAGDPDWAEIPQDWYLRAEAASPVLQKLVSLHLDAEVLDWFEMQGAGYEARINAVLRGFIDHQAKKRTG